MCLLAGTLGVQAQVFINAVPPAQNFQIEDLWNLSISGNDTSYSHFKLNMQISEASKGLLFDLTSSPFQLNGTTLYVNESNLSDFKPFESNYINSSELSAMGQTGGSFLIGDYTVEYNLLGTTSGNPAGTYTSVNQESYNHSVFLIQPTTLIFVLDQDTIDDKHPSFVWTPSILPPGYNDGTSNPEVTYTYNLTKVIGNQSPFQAISSNTMYYTQSGLSYSYLQYPYSATELEDSATYAWQVHAYVNSGLLSSSEIWTFTLMKKEKKIKVPTPLLRKERTQNFVKVTENTIGFSYMEEYGQGENSFELTVRFYNEQQHSYAENSQTTVNVIPGMNRYELKLCPSELNLADGIYLLELTNKKGESYYLRFIYEQETGCN